jgi:hypothetical protein
MKIMVFVIVGIAVAIGIFFLVKLAVKNPSLLFPGPR